MTRTNRLLPCLVVILLVAVTTAQAAATDLGIQAGHFTINGQPTFLYGVSYYGALGAPRERIQEDLDDIERNGFNWIRVWATWSAFENNVSAVDDQGHAQPKYLARLKWLVAECDRRGIVVDVTLTRGEGRIGTAHFSSGKAHGRALGTLTDQLKPWRNWYFDIANERNLRAKFLSLDDVGRFRHEIKQRDPERLVTASYAGVLKQEELRKYLFVAKVDLLALHRPRNSRSAHANEAKTRQIIAQMRELGRVVPLHYQEPFRRDFSKGWQPSVADFVVDLQGAIAGGAAGWCFHNGDNRWGPGGRPRRSFDLREQRLFDQWDPVERRALPKLAAVVQGGQ